jgi:hypothetical protein
MIIEYISRTIDLHTIVAHQPNLAVLEFCNCSQPAETQLKATFPQRAPLHPSADLRMIRKYLARCAQAVLGKYLEEGVR